MNNFEEIFRLSGTMEKREKLRTLNWLYNQGRRLIKLNQQFGSDTTELEKTQQFLKEFIERI